MALAVKDGQRDQYKPTNQTQQMVTLSSAGSFSENNTQGTALCKYGVEHYSASVMTFHYFDMTHAELKDKHTAHYRDFEPLPPSKQSKESLL